MARSDIEATRSGTYLALGTLPNDGHKFMSACLVKADTGEFFVVIGMGDGMMIHLQQSTFEDWRDWLNEVLPITTTQEVST